MSDFIYNQKKIPKGQWRYGLRSSAVTGCGWIATYNALRLMGYHVNVEKLIQYFVWQMPLINGNMGTFLLGPAIFFRQKGFQVKVAVRRKRFDRLVRDNDVGVLFYYWHRRFRFGAHFVAVRYKDGKFVGYNTYTNSNGPDPYGESLERFLERQKYRCPVLMVIKDKKNKFGQSGYFMV